jgi:hypothetical protein
MKLTPEQWTQLRQAVEADDRETFEAMIRHLLHVAELARRKAEEIRPRGRWLPER